MEKKPSKARTLAGSMWVIAMLVFVAGMQCAEGIHNVLRDYGKYEWISNFLMAAAWVLLSAVEGTKVNRANRLRVSSEPAQLEGE